MSLIKNNIKLTKDKGTKATVRVTQGGFNGKLFNKCDAQVTVNVGSPERAQKMNIGGSMVRYTGFFNITAYAINKTGITGKKMRWKLREEIKRIIREKRKNPGGGLRHVDIESTGEGQDLTSKPPYWTVIVMVRTLRYETT